jgi:DNA segregation ATPase FtsK/SpoIIIE-like protein
MDNSLKVILSKLDDIDGRLKTLETGKSHPPGRGPQTPLRPADRDPLFAKAVEIMEKHEEISALTLQQALKIDKSRAEKLLDALEAAGYGECSWREG